MDLITKFPFSGCDPRGKGSPLKDWPATRESDDPVISKNAAFGRTFDRTRLLENASEWAGGRDGEEDRAKTPQWLLAQAASSRTPPPF